MKSCKLSINSYQLIDLCELQMIFSSKNYDSSHLPELLGDFKKFTAGKCYLALGLLERKRKSEKTGGRKVLGYREFISSSKISVWLQNPT